METLVFTPELEADAQELARRTGKTPTQAIAEKSSDPAKSRVRAKT